VGGWEAAGEVKGRGEACNSSAKDSDMVRRHPEPRAYIRPSTWPALQHFHWGLAQDRGSDDSVLNA